MTCYIPRFILWPWNGRRTWILSNNSSIAKRSKTQNLNLIQHMVGPYSRRYTKGHGFWSPMWEITIFLLIIVHHHCSKKIYFKQSITMKLTLYEIYFQKQTILKWTKEVTKNCSRWSFWRNKLLTSFFFLVENIDNYCIIEKRFKTNSQKISHTHNCNCFTSFFPIQCKPSNYQSQSARTNCPFHDLGWNSLVFLGGIFPHEKLEQG